MTLHELKENSKAAAAANIGEDELQKLTPLYIVLDLDKRIFGKVVDAIGIDTLLARAPRWERLQEASDEYDRARRYKREVEEARAASERLGELARSIAAYEEQNRLLPSGAAK